MSKRDDTDVSAAAVEEMRRLYDNISTSFEHLRTKALALLAGELAIIPIPFFWYKFVCNITAPARA